MYECVSLTDQPTHQGPMNRWMSTLGTGWIGGSFEASLPILLRLLHVLHGTDRQIHGGG